MSREVVVVSAARTAIGTFGGSLKDVPPTELGATVVRDIRTQLPEVLEALRMMPTLVKGAVQRAQDGTLRLGPAPAEPASVPTVSEPQPMMPLSIRYWMASVISSSPRGDGAMAFAASRMAGVNM